MNKIIYQFMIVVLATTIGACENAKQVNNNKLEVVASSNRQWTGVAVDHVGRVFVNYPKWSNDVPVSVAEIIDGKAVAYPNKEWNDKNNAESFMAVQSVVIDNKNRLWVLDTRNPIFAGVKEGGPVLYQFNLETNKKEHAFQFADDVYKENSYFNDVRIDTEKQIAYMTDSGDGALIVLDLSSGESRRLLDHHSSTESEVDYLICDGKKWENAVPTDGIALTKDHQYLYYIALTGHTLYRIKTVALLNNELSQDVLASNVETVKTIPATDGMMFDTVGNLWLGGLENNSINKINLKGELISVVKDSTIRWADSFAQDKKGHIYFTTSQIHLPGKQRQAYEVIKIDPTQLDEVTKL